MEASNKPYQSPAGQPQNSAGKGVRVQYCRGLPPVCALCGARAVTQQPLVFLGVLGEIARLNRWMDSGADVEGVVLLPLCEKHRSFRRGWPLRAQLVLALFALTLVVAAPLLCLLFGGHPITLAFVALLSGSELAVSAWFLKNALRIHASRVTSRDVVLVGTAPEFIRACEEMKRREVQAVEDSLDGF